MAEEKIKVEVELINMEAIEEAGRTYVKLFLALSAGQSVTLYYRKLEATGGNIIGVQKRIAELFDRNNN